MPRFIALCLALLALTACETAKGAGKDIRKAGDVIEDTAQQIQKSF